ncbi:hypothetical protein FE257_005049 [Aspergillus nanangensis]|uniref:Grh/CP2 DB domain-containing protein n=1 Tax=Aspergillus nanangensis TaxID=2582783 RepID=A0AAD4CRJ4_ASPNN|nr:hypothetical protein FE257_005049 [Aspergillus nanangensis]
MFTNRNNDQKPNAEFLRKFQDQFAESIPNGPRQDVPPQYHHIQNQPITPSRLVVNGGDMKVGDNTRVGQDMRFSSGYVDPNSLSFMSSAHQHGYYTPNSGSAGEIYHNQAGDLHTPNMALNMMTPLSLPQQLSASTISADPPLMNLDHFNQSFMSQPFQHPAHFTHQQPFAPSTFVQDSGYDAMEDQVDELSLNDVDMQGHSSSQLLPSTMQHPEHIDYPTPGEKFRYHVTLRAPTAMIKDQNEIPVSYLNKGQAYSISVIDTAPRPMGNQPVKYRTFIRVSFQDKEQRSRPAACWQLWKEGRGSNEAHQRGGKLQAVEYVDPVQGGIEDQKHRPVQLESSSFDGFCVTWTPNPATGSPDCAISVRFNFLSTDFSHSKGVKGIPVRLCTKTEIISPDQSEVSPGGGAEVCYCRVKLFRDHGAERKLSNDIAHVKKSIEKLRQQIAQTEMGAGNYGKRKRSGGSIAIKNPDTRPAKITKHKRTWSMGSQDAPERMSMEDDLHMKLALMQEMFTSTRPVSILALRGDDEDDPDQYPVKLPERDFVKKEGAQAGVDRKLTLQTLSPTNSSMSLNSPCHPSNIQPPGLYYDSGYQASISASGDNSRHCSETSLDKAGSKPVRVQRLPSGDSASIATGYIEAVDIDPTYRPPMDRPAKPIACFYIRFPRTDHCQDEYYRAVYLTERTVSDLMRQISTKQRFDPDRIVRVLHVKQNGLKIMVDDDVVRELPDGQDMVVEITEASIFDNAVPPTTDGPSPAVEVQLNY